MKLLSVEKYLKLIYLSQDSLLHPKVNNTFEIIIMYKYVAEGISQAIGQLRANLLRSILSLMGISIGIFCIITVKSSVDSLEANIRESFDKLGQDVLYLSKMPWNEDPFTNYWKYMRRPNPSFKDYQLIKDKVPSAAYASFATFEGNRIAKSGSNSVEGAFLVGCTEEYTKVFNLECSDGRFFNMAEYNNGVYCCAVGTQVANSLFPTLDPIDRYIIVGGHKLRITGVIKKSGNAIINPLNFDNCILMPFTLMKKISNLNPNSMFSNTSVNIKAAEGVSLAMLKDDIIAVLRGKHRLHPSEGNDFSLNEISILDDLISSFFGILNAVGFIIGGFSILVGMFSVANIMFVSVKERTNIIGIKKALGAPRKVIILEFLIEAIVLCILGGILGLILVFLMVSIINTFIDFEIFLSVKNIVFGLITSALIGILAGLLPAIQASKLDPVEAIRQ